MDRETTKYRIQVKWQCGEVPNEYVIRSLRDMSGLGKVKEELRQKWVTAIVKSFSPSSKSAANTRPWDILLHQNGSMETLPSEKGGQSPCPSRFRIPSCNVRGLDEAEMVKRAERFALGSLLYEVMTTKEPFEELRDDEVQDHYARGIFPDDVFSMAMGPYILGCWCREFEKEMKKLLPSIVDRFRAYAKAHPYLLASQIAGGVATTASLVALPVLGAAGFAATGPMAGSAVAAWQSSQGLVQAGSLFAWCQSAAMGGAAVNGIVAGGVVGGTATLAATAAGVAGGPTVLTPEKMKEIFTVAYHKENRGEEVARDPEKSTR